MGMRRAWQILTTRLTSSVLAGRTIIKGVSAGSELWEDQSEPEWSCRSSSRVDTCSRPTTATQSAHAAWRLEGFVLCDGGGTVEMGVVEVAGGSAGLSEPR